MSEHWTPVALCTNGGLVAWGIVLLVQFYQYAWFLMTGFSYGYQKMWLSFLVLYGYFEEIFINWALSNEFAQPRPLCNLVFDPEFEASRNHGMPSIEVELSVTMSVFITAYLLISREYPRQYTFVILVAFPIVLAGCMWTTNNNTFFQIFVGAAVGAINAIRRIIMYQYFIRTGLILMAKRYKAVQWLLPTNEDF
jgi:hypothetical protein